MLQGAHGGTLFWLTVWGCWYLPSALRCLAGFKEVSVEAVPAEQSHPGREGKEMLGRWQRL